MRSFPLIDGGLVGYAAVIPGGSKFIFDFYVDPNWKHEGLNEILLSRCEVRGMEIWANSGSSSSTIAKTYVAKVNQRDVDIVEQAGFKFVKYHFQMRMQLHSMPIKPDWPENITFRTFSLNHDELDVYELIEKVFEKPGRSPSTFEEWKDHMLRPEIFEPELWFLCLEEGRIVGACLCFEYPGEGWVRQLGVDESNRRRGLGTALLQHSFRTFKKRGINRVGLAVAADNSKANAFYENLGLECVRTYVEYEKMIEV